MGAKKQVRLGGRQENPLVAELRAELAEASRVAARRTEDARLAREQRDALSKEACDLREELNDEKRLRGKLAAQDEEALTKIMSERDTLKRENGRLKRIVKGLRDAFVAATEEDAPNALPFG